MENKNIIPKAATFSQPQGDMLYNVCKVVIEELDEATGNVKTGGVKASISCDSEIGLEPVINEGAVVTRRDSKSILARVKEADLLESMNLTLTTVKFSPDILAMVQGGTLKMGTADSANKVIGYSAPTMAQGVTGKKTFKLTAYVENYAGDDLINYVKFSFNKCKGKPINLDLKKDFFAPQFVIEATENTKAKKSIYEFDYIDALPVE